MFYCALNINVQKIVAFLTAKALPLRGIGAHAIEALWSVLCPFAQYFFKIKVIKNYKNRLRLAKVIVKYRLPRFLLTTVE